MKQSEEAPRTPLAKLAVKATNGVFVIELSTPTLRCGAIFNCSRKINGSTSRSSTSMAAEPSWP